MIRYALFAAAFAVASPALAGDCQSKHSHTASHEHAAHSPVVMQTVAHHEAATETPDIVDTAVSAGSFNTLVTAVKAAGLVDALKGEGPFTVFAPTDEAFAKIPAETLQSLLEPGAKDQLTKILTYHVVPGSVKAEQVVTLDSAKTLQGGEVTIRVEDGAVFVNDSQVVKTDIVTSNGVIHVIDTVLMPAE